MTEKAISEAGEEHTAVSNLGALLHGSGLEVFHCDFSLTTEISRIPGGKTAFIGDKF